jgi:type I restriction enzyme, S subunit
VNPRWLLEVLSTHYVQEQCQLRAVGTTFKTLNIWDLRRILVPRAPSATQRQLAVRIGDVAATLEQVLRHLDSQVALLRVHRQSVITAAVNGALTIPGRAG